MEHDTPSRLSDPDLTATLLRLARDERATTVALIAHLAEFDARRLYLGAGFSSTFTYCTGLLRLSEAEAYNRIEAARAARRFPVVLERLADRSVNLTTMRLVARHLNEDNHEALLAEAGGKSKREVEELLARHFPEPAVATSVQRLPGPNAGVVPLLSPAAADAARPPDRGAEEPGVAVTPAAPVPGPRQEQSTSRPPLLRPIAADRYEIRFTASRETYEKLRLAQDLLSHAVSAGDVAEIIDRALSALVEKVTRKTLGATDRPRPERAPRPGSPHIPAKVRRTVWIRDGGRCAFVSAAGHRCGERRFLHFHHVVPYAVGGKATVENIQLRCRAHNQYEADLFFRVGIDSFRDESVVRPERAPAVERSP